MPEQYNFINLDIDMRFQSFDVIPLGEHLDGEKFGFPGVKVIIVGVRAESDRNGDNYYDYDAKVTK